MGRIAFVFPGQGAQSRGMGRGLYEKSPAARLVFDNADKIRPGTVEQCFSGSAEELARTENTQPCLYCVDLAAASALAEAGIKADMLAGFSLGELAALAFSGAVTYDDGFRLVCERARFMQEASAVTGSGMAVVLKQTDEEVIALCEKFDNVYPVNFNCEGQVSVAGVEDELVRFMAAVKEAGGRAAPLKVGGGFHSPFMAGASERFVETLKRFTIAQPGIPLYSNVTAQPYDGDYKELLARQIRSPVLWRKTIINMIDAGADTFIEVGPGKTLCNLVSRISDRVQVFNVEDGAGLEKTILGVCASA